MTKIIKLHTKEERDIPYTECSICNCKFSPDDEGGLIGTLGVLPVQFCPTCLSGVISMVHYIEKKDKETFE